MKKDIRSLATEEIGQWVKSLSLPSFRSKQIYEWLHKYGVRSFEDMSNIPKQLREKLAAEFSISNCKIENKYL